jgi:hypothetical protein
MKTIDRKRATTAAEIASLILANAFVFHEMLAKSDHRVKSLQNFLAPPDPKGLHGAPDPIRTLNDHWIFIQREINYVPIFSIASDILSNLPAEPGTIPALRRLSDSVSEIIRNRTALRHDLMGRIYHTLLLDAKYLGTYYTSVPSATLLLKLALAPTRWQANWSDLEQIKTFRAADLSCGTGTLLMAAQQAITDNFIHTTAASGHRVTQEMLRELHQVLVEQTLYGYDVLASAVHLTASTLALLAPDIGFKHMNLFCLPLGVQEPDKVYLGSVEYAQSTKVLVQFDLMDQVRQGSRVTGKGDVETAAPLPKLDLCVMNPPFTRSVGGNLLFGSLPEEERKTMQKKLAGLMNHRSGTGEGLMASSTAGLGSVFVAVADRHLKDDGRMALVLPQALASGVAWQQTRDLFAKRYAVETVVVSHDPERWNFSESTSLSEILVVAKKRGENGVDNGARTTFVNLWRNCKTPMDALSVARAVRETEPAEIESGHGATPIEFGGRVHGEIISVPWTLLKRDQWYPCLFAQTDLVRAAHYLRQGVLYEPGVKNTPELPMTYLSSLGELGPDVRDIHDGFRKSRSQTSFPAFWGHDADEVTTLRMETNAYLQPLSKAKPGRSLRNIELLWPKAGRVLIVERMRFNTQRVLTVRVSKPCLATSWWPLRLVDGNGHLEKTLVLWLNSTLGILGLMSHRVPTQGAWVKFKKPQLATMPVLDLWRLSEAQIMKLADTYDSIGDEALRPLPEMAEDPIRKVIDDSISEVLGLPALDRLREALAREPVISLRQL